MHDTHDVRKSKDLHDKEMLIDEKREIHLRASDLSDDQVFRYELLQVLGRIAKALEYFKEGTLQVRDRF